MNVFKKIIAFAIAGITLCAGFTACSDSETPPPVENKLVLTAAPTSVKANEEVTFKVTDDGKDVTASAKIMNMTENGAVVTNPWSTSKPGVYQFAAVYDGKTSLPIPVTVKSGIESGNYKRRALAIDFTGTQCTACPGMTSMLNKYEKDNPDRVVIIGAHVNIPSADPLTTEEGLALAASQGINSAPNVWVDYREKPIGTIPSTFKAFVTRSLNEYPAICGIKISSTVSGSTITANVAARFSGDGDFKICAVLLEDKVNVPGSYETTYNHVLRKYATSASGDAIGACVTGQEVPKTFTFTADPSWNLDNCHVVVYLLNANDGKYFVNNVRDCPANGSVDFDEEE